MASVDLTRSAAIEIGAWRFQPSLLQATRGAETVRLEPKTLQVLLHLARQPGQVVAKEELHRSVWDGAYAAEDGLRRAVLQLRRLFEDDAERPRCIETVPRIGYRLLLPVRAGEGSAPVVGPRRPPTWLLLGACSLAAGALLLALGHAGRDPLRRSLGEAPVLVPLTSYPGLEHDPALSPDGSRVAFVWQREGEGRDLWVKLLDREEPLQLTDHSGDESEPAWSPDGQWLAFARRSRQETTLALVPASGGAERPLLRLEPTPIHGLAWAGDGSLVYASGPREGEPGALYRLELATLAVERLTRPPGGLLGDRQPAVSPDGRTVAFLRSSVHGVDDVYLLSLAAARSAPSRVTYLQCKMTDLAWQPGGRHLVLARLHDFRYGLWSLPAGGGPLRSLGLGDDDAFEVSVSATGHRLVYARERSDSDLVRYEGEPGALRSRPVASSTHADWSPDVAPAGDRIAFASKRSGSSEIWASDANGERLVALTRFGGPYVTDPRWSPDGARVAFDARPGGNADIFVVTLAAGEPVRLTEPPAEDVAPNWSRDGRSIYFASNRTDEWQVWRKRLDGGAAVQVTRHGGFFAAESRDGRWLYFSRQHASGLLRMPLAGGREVLFRPELEGGAWANWREVEGGLLLLTAAAGPGWDLVRIGADGRRETLLHRDGWPPNPGLAVSERDGSLLLGEVRSVEGDLMLLRAADG
jgi:Tol biopolymer transport system component/DNA-binding winged helix-turn-helix (wHTH) protein